MNFHESESYLLSLGNEVETMKLGLENIRTLLEALDDPQNSYLKVQVAGTNGKGSVCAFLDSICREAGISAGLFTSPHLVSITERIKIGGKDVSEEEFARLATLVRETSESLVADGKLERVPTYFEQVTAMALVAFRDAKVELAILETGLGGRYDATTAANAEIAAITRIDLDHQEYLGDTIEEIAAEKAAIIRPDSIVCVGRQVPEANRIILRRCSDVGIVPNTLNESVWETASSGVDFQINSFNAGEVMVALNGEHQNENAALAILTAQKLREFFSISDGKIIDGLEHAKHPGRLEWMEIGWDRILLDGAHNVSGALALRDYLSTFASDTNIALVFGIMKDKDTETIARILFPLAKDLILTFPPNSRAADPYKFQNATAKIVGTSNLLVIPSVADAVDTAIELSRTYTGTKRALTCITGSLYLIGEAKRILSSQI